MESILLITGASIFGLLGTIHLIYTLFTNRFNARDSSVTAAMKSGAPVLTRETSMWRAWVGFNISHSLGAMLFAAVYIPLTLRFFEVIQESLWFSILPAFVAAIYLVTAVKYWFRVPVFGIALALVCFLAAAVLINN